MTIADLASDDPRLPYSLATPADLDAAVVAAQQSAVGSTVTGLAVDACDERAIRNVVADVGAGPEDWTLRAVIVAARAGIPARMRHPQPRAGRFVAVASTAASRGLPMLSAYCAAKAGVVGFVRALASELRGSGITANTVSPGSTDTAILAQSARLYSLEQAVAFAQQQPIERLIEPGEIAAVVAFLAGPAAGAITGADHVVDGGLSI